MNTFLKMLLIATISALFLSKSVVAKEASIRALAGTKRPTKAPTKRPTKAPVKAPVKAPTSGHAPHPPIAGHAPHNRHE